MIPVWFVATMKNEKNRIKASLAHVANQMQLNEALSGLTGDPGLPLS